MPNCEHVPEWVGWGGFCPEELRPLREGVDH